MVMHSWILTAAGATIGTAGADIWLPVGPRPAQCGSSMLNLLPPPLYQLHLAVVLQILHPLKFCTQVCHPCVPPLQTHTLCHCNEGVEEEGRY